MLKLSWLLTLLTASFEYIWSKAWSPMIDAPAVSAPTCVLIAALLLFTLYRWAVALKRLLRANHNRVTPIPLQPKTAGAAMPVIFKTPRLL